MEPWVHLLIGVCVALAVGSLVGVIQGLCWIGSKEKELREKQLLKERRE